VVDEAVGASIEDVLLIGPCHRRWIAGRGRFPRRGGPVVMAEARAIVPPDVMDMTIGRAIEDVFLIGLHHCRRVASRSSLPRRGGPLIVE